jgi:hypothetical protein
MDRVARLWSIASRLLRLAEQQVHHPAPADVWPRPPAVGEYLGAVRPAVPEVPFVLPDEVVSASGLIEGAVRTITVRAFERSGIGNSTTPFSLFTGQAFGKGDTRRRS